MVGNYKELQKRRVAKRVAKRRGREKEPGTRVQ
jgi:hypothetical protein